MSSYKFFAGLYDTLTENVNYKVRSDYISGFFTADNINSGTIVDLACGTGSFGVQLAEKGYSIIGVDMSEEMLCQAQYKLENADCEYTLINSKMQNFKSDIQADGVICMLDSINHLTVPDDVKKTFQNAFSYLKKGGLFIFDVNTVYKHQQILFDNTFVFDEEDYYLVWDNERVNDREVRILLDFFLFNGTSYDRYSEEFSEYAYSVEELTEMLNQSGFNSIKIYDELTHEAPKENSERIYFVCKKEDE